jgi:N6-adenosine-specific RNA methylase IME4
MFKNFPQKKYVTIYLDPPYPIKWLASSSIGTKPLEYPTLTIAELAELPIKNIAEDLSNLYCWTTNEFLPETLGLVRIWGFHYHMLWTWCKNNGIGGHPRNATEHIVIASRGAAKALDKHEKATLNWLCHPRLEHSVKPAVFRTMIEKFSPPPRIELFARQKYSGWDTWGLEAPKETQQTLVATEEMRLT